MALATQKVFRITFEKGIDESQSPSVLPNGFLSACQNWIPEPTGVLRPRSGWVIGPGIGSNPATRKTRGAATVLLNLTAKWLWGNTNSSNNHA